MSRKSSLESGSHYHISSVLTKLRGSLTKADASSTDRVGRNKSHCSVHESLEFPSGLRNSHLRTKEMENRGSASSSLKGLFKSHSKPRKEQGRKQPSKNNKRILQYEFKQCVGKLDHKKHTHVGENQCFLGYKCFITIMSEMGYLENWRSDSAMMDDIWKDLGGEDYGGFLKSNLLLLLEIVEGLAGAESERPEFDREHHRVRTEKNKKVYLKYQRLRDNRTKSKERGINLESVSDLRQLKNKEEENSNNLGRLRKSLISRGNETGGRQPIKLRKREKKNSEESRLFSTEVTEGRKSTQPSQKSYRVNLKLDVESKVTKLDEQTKGMPERAQTQSLSLSHQFTLPFIEEEIDETPIPVSVKGVALPQPERIALLSLDLNLGEGKSDKIIVYQGDTPQWIAESLVKRHSLNPDVTLVLERILESHLSHILSKIQEVEEMTEDLGSCTRQI